MLKPPPPIWTAIYRQLCPAGATLGVSLDEEHRGAFGSEPEALGSPCCLIDASM
jgi:hypothetical protein